MAKTEPQIEDDFTRTCARTGEEKSGKFYILRTTDGEELVHEDAFWGVSNDDQADDDQGPAAKVPAARRAPAKKG